MSEMQEKVVVILDKMLNNMIHMNIGSVELIILSVVTILKKPRS